MAGLTCDMHRPLLALIRLLYFPRRVMAHRKVLPSWRSGVITITEYDPRSVYVNRLAKYASRGYRLHIPGLKLTESFVKELKNEGDMFNLYVSNTYHSEGV